MLQAYTIEGDKLVPAVRRALPRSPVRLLDRRLRAHARGAECRRAGAPHRAARAGGAGPVSSLEPAADVRRLPHAHGIAARRAGRASAAAGHRVLHSKQGPVGHRDQGCVRRSRLAGQELRRLRPGGIDRCLPGPARHDHRAYDRRARSGGRRSRPAQSHAVPASRQRASSGRGCRPRRGGAIASSSGFSPSSAIAARCW